MVNNWLINHLFPPRCLICGQVSAGESNRDLCPACELELKQVEHPCARCGIPLTQSAAGTGLCGRCQRDPPPYDRCIAPYIYQRQIRFLLTQLKYGGRLSCARLVGGLLAERLARDSGARPDAVVPVPLHPSRLRERGFNQALEVARVVTHALNVPLDDRSLTRIRATPAQTELSRGERLNNLKGAFQFRGTRGLKRVAVVDDVVTTGSTASEITKQIKKAGVAEVVIWAVARTPD